MAWSAAGRPGITCLLRWPPAPPHRLPTQRSCRNVQPEPNYKETIEQIQNADVLQIKGLEASKESKAVRIV